MSIASNLSKQTGSKNKSVSEHNMQTEAVFQNTFVFYVEKNAAGAEKGFLPIFSSY
jgi:hypothetical protein